MDIGIHQLLRRIVCANLLVLLVPSSAYAEEVASLDFRVRFSSEIHDRPFTGRVYLFFSKKRKEPRSGPGWFGPDPFVARDVKDWQPDEPLTFSAKKPVGMLAFPQPLAKMRLAGYRVQAVVRFNPQARRVGGGAGNGYSSAMILPTDGDQPASEPLELTVNKLIPSRKFTETKWGKQLRIHSKLLSDFHGRDVFMRAAVILPASYYDQPQRHYPTIFSIPGFGGTHFGGQARNPIKVTNRHGVEFLRVILDPSCPFGHHVFADSANNGPVGRALIEELIPAYEKTFRCVAKPTARFLTGHSSGGWSSLWLQVTYPDCFGGTWSTAPDPVDFRDF